jgi:hypothetical protein
VNSGSTCFVLAFASKPGGAIGEEFTMRNLLWVGTILSLGLIGSAAVAANPNVPSYSPYALMDVAPPEAGSMFAPAPAMSETRAGYVDNGTAYVANPNVPSYSPYAIMPKQ